jgi:hypothetical protein
MCVSACPAIRRPWAKYAHMVKLRNDTYADGLRAAMKKNTPHTI